MLITTFKWRAKKKVFHIFRFFDFPIQCWNFSTFLRKGATHFLPSHAGLIYTCSEKSDKESKSEFVELPCLTTYLNESFTWLQFYFLRLKSQVVWVDNFTHICDIFVANLKISVGIQITQIVHKFSFCSGVSNSLLVACLFLCFSSKFTLNMVR